MSKITEVKQVIRKYYKVIFSIMVMMAIIVAMKLKYNKVEDSAVITQREILSQSTELLAIMENKMKLKGEGISQTSVEEKSDYTKLFPELYTVYNVPFIHEDDKKRVFLTFDDGPSDNTYKILDTLQEHDMKATFFVIGGNITREYEGALKRMINEGHTIGVHCYSHVCNDLYCSVERFLEDFNEVYQKIYELTGERVNVYRFPWGSNNAYGKKIKDTVIDELDRRGFSCYDWTTSADDAIGKPTASSMKKNILRDLEFRDNPIVLMHDGASNRLTAKTLPDILSMLKGRGYEFDTLSNRKAYIFPW